MQKITALLLAAVTFCSFAGTIDQYCPELTAHGAPQGQVVNQELCRPGYAIGYSYHYKDPVYSIVKLTSVSVQGKVKRGNSFREDSEIPEEYRATLNDYQVDGNWDRGHMAAAGDLNWSTASMHSSFLLSNMIPQNPKVNRGMWRRLEMLARSWALQRGTLFVYTGPVFYNNFQTIGNSVAVPQELYKIIYDPKHNDAIAFIMPNREINSARIQQYIVSVETIERLTNITFFPMLLPYDSAHVKLQLADFARWNLPRDGNVENLK